MRFIFHSFEWIFVLTYDNVCACQLMCVTFNAALVVSCHRCGNAANVYFWKQFFKFGFLVCYEQIRLDYYKFLQFIIVFAIYSDRLLHFGGTTPHEISYQSEAKIQDFKFFLWLLPSTVREKNHRDSVEARVESSLTQHAWIHMIF